MRKTSGASAFLRFVSFRGRGSVFIVTKCHKNERTILVFFSLALIMSMNPLEANGNWHLNDKISKLKAIVYEENFVMSAVHRGKSIEQRENVFIIQKTIANEDRKLSENKPCACN